MARGLVRQQAIQGAPRASTEALELLIDGLFDYAGMFPPASLELDAAIWESARSTKLRRPHMVAADLVVALDDLPRLDEERLRMAGFADTEAKVAVVGFESADLADATDEVAAKNDELAGVLRVVSLEPHGTTFPGAALRAAAGRLPGVQLYVEPRMPDPAWARNAPAIVRLLHRLKADGHSVGLKVRGSGGNAISAATLGWLIPQVAALGSPFKATAGLHHPLVEPARYQNTLGFVGLAAALRLRQALGDAVPLDHVQHCVAEQDPAAFSFDGELSWRGHAITLDALRQAKRDLPFTIGSCSLREPDEDLARLWS
jgi:hypothetical protein